MGVGGLVRRAGGWGILTQDPEGIRTESPAQGRGPASLAAGHTGTAACSAEVSTAAGQAFRRAGRDRSAAAAAAADKCTAAAAHLCQRCSPAPLPPLLASPSLLCRSFPRQLHTGMPLHSPAASSPAGGSGAARVPQSRTARLSQSPTRLVFCTCFFQPLGLRDGGGWRGAVLD